MDSITQSLLGAVTAQLGFRQKIGRDATWVAAGAAIVPDLDIFISPFLSLSGLEVDTATIHRGLSHSLLAVPLLALPIAVIWWWFRGRRHRRHAGDAFAAGNDAADAATSPPRDRPPPFWLLYACVLVAVLSHPLLDWCTTYGTQLLAPLTKTRFAADAIAIVDIIYSPLLILTLAACYIVRKACGGRAVRATLIIGWVGFALSVGYIATGRALHDRVVARAAAAADGARVVHADAYPALGTIFLWRVVLETDDEWIALRAHVFDSRPVSEWPSRRAEKVSNEWIAKARSLHEAETYNWFANGRLRAAYRTSDGHHEVTLHDMRYGQPTESLESFWPLTVIFDRKGDVVHVGRRGHPNRRSFRTLAADAWKAIWTVRPAVGQAAAPDVAGAK